ncbi:hypothetical protein C8R47DRAFT_1192321 [Mycena vitilis]|nr:hypothetical protein C8R47DRAFT_1192321 [Mycena vitilis]
MYSGQYISERRVPAQLEGGRSGGKEGRERRHRAQRRARRWGDKPQGGRGEARLRGQSMSAGCRMSWRAAGSAGAKGREQRHRAQRRAQWWGQKPQGERGEAPFKRSVDERGVPNDLEGGGKCGSEGAGTVPSCVRQHGLLEEQGCGGSGGGKRRGGGILHDEGRSAVQALRNRREAKQAAERRDLQEAVARQGSGRRRRRWRQREWVAVSDAGDTRGQRRQAAILGRALIHSHAPGSGREQRAGRRVPGNPKNFPKRQVAPAEKCLPQLTAAYGAALAEIKALCQQYRSTADTLHVTLQERDGAFQERDEALQERNEAHERVKALELMLGIGTVSSEGHSG